MLGILASRGGIPNTGRAVQYMYLEGTIVSNRKSKMALAVDRRVGVVLRSDGMAVGRETFSSFNFCAVCIGKQCTLYSD